MSRAPLLIVCAPFPKTGASTFTRLLCAYHQLEERAFDLFDTDPHSRSLAHWHPRACQVSDLTTTRGQIALFDRLVAPGEQARIVEVASQVYARFLGQARDIGLFEEAEKNGVAPTLLFVTNGSEVALEAARALRGVWPEAPLIPVLNHGPVRLGPKRNDHIEAFRQRDCFEVPALDPSAREVIEQPDFSLTDFLRAPPPDDMSLVVRADLRNWLKRVFTQFRSRELRIAFEAARYLTRV
jgi:hypothetical protein